MTDQKEAPSSPRRARGRPRDWHDKTEQNWFMIGAAAIIVGIVLGLILPRLRVRRRRSEWGDF